MRLILPRSIVSPIVALAAQIAWAGGHSGSHSSGPTVHVNGYYRKDGTYVHSYDRAAPGYGSYSTAPNVYGSTRPTTSTTTSTASTATAPSAPYVAPIPNNATVHVHEYYRQDGTYVKEFVRSAPGTADTVIGATTARKPVNTTASAVEATALATTATAVATYLGW
jgi:hypothetical protein